MKKFVLIITALVVVSGLLGIYFYLDYLKSSSVKETLSARSKEFIQEQKNKNDLYRLADFDKKEKKINEKFIVEDCFSVVVAYEVRFVNKDPEKKCYRYFSLADPRGSITLYLEEARGLGLDQASGVSLRRQKTDLYKEEKEVVNGTDVLIFQDLSKPYEKISYLKLEDFYVIAALSLSNAEDDNGNFVAFIKSIKLL